MKAKEKKQKSTRPEKTSKKNNAPMRHAFEIGKSYFIRSVTHHYLGTVRQICDLCIVMDHCVWVADDGRFHKLMRGEWDHSSEREPYGHKRKVQIFYGALLDAVEWDGPIPREVK